MWTPSQNDNKEYEMFDDSMAPLPFIYTSLVLESRGHLLSVIKLILPPLLLRTCCRLCWGLQVDDSHRADNARKYHSGKDPPCRLHSEDPGNLADTHTARWSGCSDSHPGFRPQSSYTLLQREERKRYYQSRVNVFLINSLTFLGKRSWQFC